MLPFLLFVLLGQQTPKEIPINTPYVQTPTEVVDEMIKIARVSKSDVVYDLGCGDGRIVIAAAKDRGARGVGIDLSPDRVREAREAAAKAGVSNRTEFREQDLFDADLSSASVVMIYLLPEVNLRLRPKLWSELKPGTRVVSHTFHMGDWKPDGVVESHGTKIYYWEIRSKSVSE